MLFLWWANEMTQLIHLLREKIGVMISCRLLKKCLFTNSCELN